MPLPKKTPVVEKTSVSEKVYRILRDWIVDGDLSPGEDIKDAELAACLGVSRTPVREALKRLESDGLVNAAASRWTRVTEIRPEDIDNLFPIIQWLDLLALEQAFPYLVPDGVAEMKKHHRAQKEAIANGNGDAAAKAGRAFHHAYVKRCDNPELMELDQKMKAKARRLRIFFYKSAEIEPDPALAAHDALIEAIENGDLEKSKAVLAKHWEHVTQQIRAAATQLED